MRVFAYDAENLTERRIEHPDDLDRLPPHSVLWLDVVGLGDPTLLRALGERFRIHELALEDIVHLGQRPKLEEYEDHLFVTMRMAMVGNEELEQVSFVLVDGAVISFQERPGDDFEPVRARLREGRPKLRSASADYLAYALIDTIVDGYLPILDGWEDALDALEDEILDRPKHDVVARLLGTKRRVVRLRRAVAPAQDALGGLMRLTTPIVRPSTRVYLADTRDHLTRAMDQLEVLRELAQALVDAHRSLEDRRLNDAMRLLTVISTIFIPLSFLAALYGMNFEHMPELSWPWGYPALLGIMAVTAGGLTAWFARRGWLR